MMGSVISDLPLCDRFLVLGHVAKALLRPAPSRLLNNESNFHFCWTWFYRYSKNEALLLIYDPTMYEPTKWGPRRRYNKPVARPKYLGWVKDFTSIFWLTTKGRHSDLPTSLQNCWVLFDLFWKPRHANNNTHLLIRRKMLTDIPRTGPQHSQRRNSPHDHASPRRLELGSS